MPEIYFKTADKKEYTLVYDMAFPSSHVPYFMKWEGSKSKIWWERSYTGNGVFEGKDYFIWVAELNLKNHKKKTMNELREIGINLYNGVQKIFVNGEEKIIKWPVILADDESPWINVKPEITLIKPEYSEKKGIFVECECDDCCMMSEM